MAIKFSQLSIGQTFKYFMPNLGTVKFIKTTTEFGYSKDYGTYYFSGGQIVMCTSLGYLG